MPSVWIITAELSSVWPWLCLAVGLLLYWNWSTVAYRLVLVAFWHCVTFQAYVMTAIAYDTCGAIVHFSRQRWLSAHSRTFVVKILMQLVPTSLSVTALVLYGGSVLDHWTLTIISHAALSAWVTALNLWLRSTSGTGCHIWERLQLFACYILVVGLLAVKWGFLATIDPTVDASVAPSLRSVHVNVWYVVIIGTLGLLFNALFGAITAALRVVMRSPVRLPFRTWLSFIVLGDCVNIDPNSDEFALISRRVQALSVLASAWVYSPPRLPLLFQVVLLACLYFAGRASEELRAYQNVLTPFPLVSPDTRTSAAVPGLSEGESGTAAADRTQTRGLAHADDICAICREPLYPTDVSRWMANPVRQLPCGHCLHGDCLRPWIVQHPDCPLCRHPTNGGPAQGSRFLNNSLVAVYAVDMVTAPQPPLRRGPQTFLRRPRRQPVPTRAAASPPPTSSTSTASPSSSTSPAHPSAAVVAPVPSAVEPSRGFGGGSVQPLVPRLRMRPPAPVATAQPQLGPPSQPQTAHIASSTPSAGYAPSTTSRSSASAGSAEGTAEMQRVEEALQKARRKRQRMLSSLSEHPSTSSQHPSGPEDSGQLFDDDPFLMGEPRGSRLPRHE